MGANDFAKMFVDIIKSNPDQVQDYISRQDWEGLQNEIYYQMSNTMEDAT